MNRVQVMMPVWFRECNRRKTEFLMNVKSTSVKSKELFRLSFAFSFTYDAKLYRTVNIEPEFDEFERSNRIETSTFGARLPRRTFKDSSKASRSYKNEILLKIERFPLGRCNTKPHYSIKSHDDLLER